MFVISPPPFSLHLGRVRKPADFCCDCRREPGEGQNPIGPVVDDGVDGEARELSVFGILDEHAAAAVADGARSRDAVVPGTGENDCDCSPAVRARGAAEEHVDRRTQPVLVRAAHHQYAPVAYRQMVVGRGDVHVAGGQVLAAARLDRRERAGAGQDPGEPTLDLRLQVDDDADRSVEVFGQALHERHQRLDAACGRADDDHTGGRLVHPCVVSRGGRAKLHGR